MSRPEIERRAFGVDMEIRSADDGQKIVGYAAVFDSYSEYIGGFRERIAKGAFSRVLGDDVRALFNHDSDIVLGRSKSGTLKLSEDETGLRVEISPPDTQAARDIMELLRRGDVDQMSFGFYTGRDTWAMDDEGNVERTILEVKSLFDVSIVTYPAYPDTSVALRGMEQFRAEAASRGLVLPDFGAMRRKLALIS